MTRVGRDKRHGCCLGTQTHRADKTNQQFVLFVDEDAQAAADDDVIVCAFSARAEKLVYSHFRHSPDVERHGILSRCGAEREVIRVGWLGLLLDT